LSCQHFIQEVCSLNFVKNSRVVNVVFTPNSANLVLDEVFFFKREFFDLACVFNIIWLNGRRQRCILGIYFLRRL